MVRHHTFFIALALGLAAGCATAGAFACASDAECVDGGTQGTCEPEGYCAFPDGGCASGKRFGAYAAALSGLCVDGDGTTDATSTTADATSTSASSTTTSVSTETDTSTTDTTDTTDTDTTTTPPEPLRVFVTSTTHNGNLAGLAGADAKCQERADAAGLGGAWMAWLSDGAIGPAARFTTRGNRPYHRLFADDPVVADDWADLTDGALQRAIDRNELGNGPITGDVWTNTAPDGTPATTAHCMGWTVATGANSGAHGDSGATDATWTQADTANCTSKLRLLCVEQ